MDVAVIHLPGEYDALSVFSLQAMTRPVRSPSTAPTLVVTSILVCSTPYSMALKGSSLSLTGTYSAYVLKDRQQFPVDSADVDTSRSYLRALWNPPTLLPAKICR